MNRAAITSCRRAFTMVEMLVVVGVIVLLVGLTVAVIPIVNEQSQKRQTLDALRLLDLAVQQWQLERDGQVTFGTDGQPIPGRHYDMHPETPVVLRGAELLRVIGRTSSTRDVVAGIDPDLLYRFDSEQSAPQWLDDPAAQSAYAAGAWDDQLVLLDAWGRPIIAVHPGAPEANADPDGTERTAAENTYGVAVNQRVLLVSAGPDARLGDLSGNEQDRAEAADNLYSYEPQSP